MPRRLPIPRSQGRLVALDQHDRQAGVAHGGGDCGAHGAAPDDTDAGDGQGLDALDRIGPAGAALGKEDMAQCRRLFAAAQVEKRLPLMRHGVVERVFGRKADRRQRAQRGVCAFGGLADAGLGFVPEPGGFRLQRAGADRLRRLSVQLCAQEGRSGGDQIALDHRVDQPQLARPGGAQRFAIGHQIDRRGHADQTRGADRSAGAGDDAQRDLGQARSGLGIRDPPAASHRNLQPAAEGRAMDRRAPRLGRALDPGDDIGQVRRLRRLAELAHVGAGDEGPASAGQHGAAHGRFGVHSRHRVPQALPDRL